MVEASAVSPSSVAAETSPSGPYIPSGLEAALTDTSIPGIIRPEDTLIVYPGNHLVQFGKFPVRQIRQSLQWRALATLLHGYPRHPAKPEDLLTYSIATKGGLPPRTPNFLENLREALTFKDEGKRVRLLAGDFTSGVFINTPAVFIAGRTESPPPLAPDKPWQAFNDFLVTRSGLIIARGEGLPIKIESIEARPTAQEAAAPARPQHPKNVVPHRHGGYEPIWSKVPRRTETKPYYPATHFQTLADFFAMAAKGPASKVRGRQTSTETATPPPTPAPTPKPAGPASEASQPIPAEIPKVAPLHPTRPAGPEVAVAAPAAAITRPAIYRAPSIPSAPIPRLTAHELLGERLSPNQSNLRDWLDQLPQPRGSYQLGTQTMPGMGIIKRVMMDAARRAGGVFVSYDHIADQLLGSDAPEAIRRQLFRAMGEDRVDLSKILVTLLGVDIPHRVVDGKHGIYFYGYTNAFACVEPNQTIRSGVREPKAAREPRLPRQPRPMYEVEVGGQIETVTTEPKLPHKGRRGRRPDNLSINVGEK